MYEMFLRTLRPSADDVVLDIGVTSDRQHPESNFFERWYPHKQQLTCVGTEDGSHLEADFPGVRFVRVTPGERLPFADAQFSIAFSNAVLEHVGDAAAQRAFLAEMARVSRRFFLTTPNRWFPVEPHTALPLVHYLPPAMFRALIRPTRYAYWADEQHLNLLTARELAALFPADAGVTIARAGIGFGVLRSNLIAWRA